MKVLHKFFSKGTNKEKPEDVMKISMIIGPLIDKSVTEIFATYKMKLLSEPITYIIPAVWGAKKDGELTDKQKEINMQVAPIIKRIFEILDLKDLSGAQEFAIGFLIRGLIISKITYMIEVINNKVSGKTNSGKKNTDILFKLEPLGNA
jgi:hypothetical protein